MKIKAMRYVLQSPLIALIVIGGTAISSEARPPGVPSQHCSDISRPRPGTLCYVLHDNLGGKATAGGSPQGGDLIIQPQAGNYVVDSTAIEVTSQAGNGTHSKRVLSTGASVSSVNGYQSKLEEVDRVINELEGIVVGACGQALCEARNKLTYLKERRAEYATYYQTAVSAGRDAPKTQYTWSASSRKCGTFNLDTCGSWINFRVYEVRRYLGDPIAEYNALIVPAINQAKSAIPSGGRPATTSFGAIAIGNVGNKRYYGWSWNSSSLGNATSLALRSCGQTNCEAYGGSNGFTSIAVSNDFYWGIGTSNSANGSRDNAIKFCRQSSRVPDTCQVVLVIDHKDGVVFKDLR
ncbi:hypothetical protein MiAbW_02701 [Microcystis aeruginosa NIES-4325]|uniref:DUF4189 domain-containing protein n=1 Tax=Microcystis aeruginosa NIES-4325 TaxID=2569534 RepID=A0A5J4FAX0_MICAE|nr:DUF4189 domain-containing protein [Microcystis aeruginosa]GEA28129.1 hypothetical protein MiAbW_02701 [Microcystis aeruginosa NIES-4325]